jgi:hypothetical protein
MNTTRVAERMQTLILWYLAKSSSERKELEAKALEKKRNKRFVTNDFFL